MINRSILVGRLVADPEVRNTQSGKAVANMRIAVDRRYKNANGEKQTDFIPIVAWDKLAELCGQYLKKGAMIGVDGSLQMKQWEQDGQKRTSYEVNAEEIQFLERASNDGEPRTQDNNSDPDADLPF